MDIPFKSSIINFDENSGDFSVVVGGIKKKSTSLKAVQKFINECDSNTFVPFDAYVNIAGHNMRKVLIIGKARLGKATFWEDDSGFKHGLVYPEDQFETLSALKKLRADYYKKQDEQRIAFRQAEARLSSTLTELKP